MWCEFTKVVVNINVSNKAAWLFYTFAYEESFNSVWLHINNLQKKYGAFNIICGSILMIQYFAWLSAGQMIGGGLIFLAENLQFSYENGNFDF